MPDTCRRFPVLALALATVAFGAHAQQAPSPSWAGWARCQISVQGPGYTDQQIHTWILTGGPPTVEGAFRIYPGTWSVAGGGSLQRTQGTQTLMAQWATNVQGMSSPIAVFVRASDGRMLLSARHAQLRAQGAVAGYQQVTIDGNRLMPGAISSEAFEWQFPVANGPSTSTTLSGSSTPPVTGSVGFMQPAGSRGTASCTWQFGQGAAAPAPPPAVTAQAVPTPATSGLATGQPSGPPAGGGGGTSGPAPCAGAPQSLTATGSTTTPGTVTMQWAAPASGVVNSYVIQASSSPGGPANLANFDTNSPALSMVVPSVPAGTYYIRVAARMSCGLSAASNEVTVVVP